MQESNTITYIIFGIVALHFFVGFGYLIYKLSPTKEDKEKMLRDSDD